MQAFTTISVETQHHSVVKPHGHLLIIAFLNVHKLSHNSQLCQGVEFVNEYHALWLPLPPKFTETHFAVQVHTAFA